MRMGQLPPLAMCGRPASAEAAADAKLESLSDLGAGAEAF